MGLRFLPPEVFAVIQSFVILSLIYAPVPLAGGVGGDYTAQTFVTSTATGVVLAFLALSTFLGGTFKIKTYHVLSGIIGAACIAFSLLTIKGGSVPGVLFLCYGGLLISTAFTLKPAAVERIMVDERPLSEFLASEQRKQDTREEDQPIRNLPRAA